MTGAELPVPFDLLSSRVLGVDMPEFYGAQHDVVVNNTMQMTAGSNVVTCTNAPFTSADTGKLAWAYGAGTTAQHLVGYLSFVNSTTCNLLATAGGAALPAVTTISKTGQLVYGTDDNAALQAAHTAAKANGRSVYFGARKYITSGTLVDGGSQLDLYGAGRKRTEIWCTNTTGFWISDAANLQRCHVRDFTLHAVNHGFADLRANANASGFQQKIFERLEIQDFAGCGWQDNTTDGPYYRFKEVAFQGWDELNTICFAAGSLTDSTALDDVAFGGAYRVGAKFARGGPNASIEGNNGFVNGISGTIATLNDGAMTAGSAVLTSAADGRFDSSMVGIAVTVSNAGSGQGPLQSSIKSVDSATQVTLYQPALFTVSAATTTIRAFQRPLRTVSDGATTAGSTTITSATAAFTSADIGSGINVVGAGWGVTGTPGDLNARIQSVTNGTTVVTNVAATATTSGAFITIASPQIKLMLVPETLVNSGLGFTCDNQKFGSELLRPGDIHVAFCDSVTDATTTDAAMTSGSAVLTSATAAFTSGMVKTRYVTVAGVGLNGASITARIIGFTNATTVTIDVTATTTATGQALSLFKARGERMPLLATTSTGTIAQAGFTNNPFSNSGNGANGYTLAPFYSTTPKLYANNFGPGNIEQGSGYLWHVEFAPGVVATPDKYAQSNQVYPMLDNNAGRDRLSPALSSLPGMVAKQIIDPVQTSGVRTPGLRARQGGGALRVNQILKTRINSFGVSANAHFVTSPLNDAQMGADSVELSFDTFAGTCFATLAQADVVVGEPVQIAFDLARGTTNPLDRIKVIIRETGGGTIHLNEYVDVPANGAETIELAWIPATSPSAFNIVFATDFAGQVKIGEPLVVRSPIPISFFRRRWLSPNGTEYTEGITDAGVLTGITANPPASFVAAPSDIVSGAKGSGALAGAVWPANFECIFVRLWGAGTISNLLFIPTVTSGNYLIGLYANSGAGRSAVPTGAAILSTASAPMSGLTANALATVALGGSQAITPGSHWGMLAIDNTTAATARETVLNTVMSAGYARDQVPGSLQAPAASGTVTTTYWPWMQAT